MLVYSYDVNSLKNITKLIGFSYQKCHNLSSSQKTLRFHIYVLPKSPKCSPWKTPEVKFTTVFLEGGCTVVELHSLGSDLKCWITRHKTYLFNEINFSASLILLTPFDSLTMVYCIRWRFYWCVMYTKPEGSNEFTFWKLGFGSRHIFVSSYSNGVHNER